MNFRQVRPQRHPVTERWRAAWDEAQKALRDVPSDGAYDGSRLALAALRWEHDFPVRILCGHLAHVEREAATSGQYHTGGENMWRETGAWLARFIARYAPEDLCALACPQCGGTTWRVGHAPGMPLPNRWRECATHGDYRIYTDDLVITRCPAFGGE